MHKIYRDPLPTGWSEEPLGALVTTKRGYSWAKEQERDRPSASTIPVIRIPNIQGALDLSDLLHVDGVTPDERTASAVTKGWTLLVGSNGNPKRIGDSVLMDQDREMVFASFLFALRPKLDNRKITDGFIACWLQAHRVHEFISETSQMTTGLANMSWSACRRLPVRFPKCEDEQTRIADTLKAADDHVCAIEQQIRKAEYVKTALLQSLFVSGVPGAQFTTTLSKIGPVPSHWDVQRLGKTFREPPFNGVSPESRPNPPGTPILNVACVSDGQCAVEAVTYVDVDEDTIRENSALKGDFFVLRGNGNRDYVGTGGWLRVDPPVNCIFSDKLIRLRFDPKRVVDGFYPYLWQSRAFQIRLQSKAQSSSGLWMMNKRDISREWIALPPREEQAEIVEILDAASEHLAVLHKQLNAARRVKQSLLQSLLTGKIRLTP
jgi:type I restriction enzyme, S subunit